MQTPLDDVVRDNFEGITRGGFRVLPIRQDGKQKRLDGSRAASNPEGLFLGKGPSLEV